MIELFVALLLLGLFGKRRDGASTPAAIPIAITPTTVVIPAAAAAKVPPRGGITAAQYAAMQAKAPARQLPASTTPAWPSASPTDLPPFPGPGWEYDTPPPAEVQRKAVELLPSLWHKGNGTHETVLTGQRWITYQASYMAGGKHGVTAWRRKGEHITTAPGVSVTQATTKGASV